MECVKSVQLQFPISDWKYEIRIGVDGCQKTANILNINKIPYYWSAQNVGVYIMRNSLMLMKPADAYAYFDADDKMEPLYLNCSLRYIHQTGIVMTAKINCDEHLKPRTGAVIEAGGAMTFTHEVLQSVGGFAPYRCAADTDFMKRVGMAGFKITEIKEGLYLRRHHSGALTRAKDTGMGSPYRKKSWAEMTDQRNKGIIKISPVVTKLEKFC